MEVLIEGFVAGCRSVMRKLEEDLSTLRTGRANPALLNGVRVPYYGQDTPLNQVGSVKAHDARTLVFAPWDSDSLASAERAILEADLGLNPTNDGNVLIIAVPPLTWQRREDLVRRSNRFGEDARVALRQHRRRVRADFAAAKRDGSMGEDEVFRKEVRVESLLSEYVQSVKDAVDKKNAQIQEV
jgi:ribosome recycling factor